MNLIQKIKSYFVKNEFGSWRNFNSDGYDLKFKSIDDETLLDIGSYIKKNLEESEQIGNKRHRLKENFSIECPSLDELLPLLKEIIRNDYQETFVESLAYNWDFRYFVGEHSMCRNTICISNVLSGANGNSGNCIYPLASIRKYNNKYYCWNHLSS
ncbi:MAG TPA: hypothetical protein VGB50_10545 [Flavobacterium sp.]|jgi:hypothetical protein